jgi:hypothetical protein
MSITFVQGRGRKVHMQDGNMTACGNNYDIVVRRSVVDPDEVCSNCRATALWKEAGGHRLFPTAGVTEPNPAPQTPAPPTGGSAPPVI